MTSAAIKPLFPEGALPTTPSYQVAARTYRPKRFEDLLGQEALVTTLTHAIETGRLPHAFIFTGVRGVGKTTTARLIARALNCVGEDGTGAETIQPCGVCEHCRSIDEDRHLDVIEMDAASRTGVDDVREVIDSAKYKSVTGRYKIYIIDEVHMLSKSAFNALLKTLEEPPAHVKFIFATTEIHKVPQTVLSRCMRFNLKRITLDHLISLFTKVCEAEGVQYEPEALKIIARAADGSARDGLSILDQAITTSVKNITLSSLQELLGLVDLTQFLGLFKHVIDGNPKSALESFAHLYDNGSDPVAILKEVCEIVHILTIGNVDETSLEGSKYQGDHLNKLREFLPQLSLPILTRIWQMCLRGLEEVRIAPSSADAARMILVRLCHVSDLPTPEELAKALQSPAPAAPMPAPSNQAAPSIETTLSQMEVRPTAQAQEYAPQPQSFGELIELVLNKNEPLLASHLTHLCRLVRFGDREVVVELLPTAPKDMPAKLSKLMTQWTGSHWTVTLSESGGQMTQAEMEKEAAAQIIKTLMNTEELKFVLEHFPDVQIETIH